MGDKEMVTPEHDIIPVAPLCDETFTCLHCQAGNVPAGKLLFQGMHVLAGCTCYRCGQFFYHTLPIGHDLLLPVCFDVDGKQFRYEKRSWQWLVRPLRDAMFRHAPQPVTIIKEQAAQRPEAIILNCLDRCFGHAFAKLWNAHILAGKYPDRSLIVLLPASMTWLVPAGVAEVWAVKAPLPVMDRRLDTLDDFIKKEMGRFTKVWLSKSYTHLHADKVDLYALLKTRPFNLAAFAGSVPTITFVLRQDRFWHRYPVEFFLFKLFVKMKWPRTLFIRRQNSLVRKTARLIRKTVRANFSVTGLGRSGVFPAWIHDLRTTTISAQDEAAWCAAYAASHLVIGVHGSNMLIPTALAAGFIEILPRHKIRHLAEDVSINYNSRYTLFLGRHVDHHAAPGLVATHAVRMILDFPYLYNNAGQG